VTEYLSKTLPKTEEQTIHYRFPVRLTFIFLVSFQKI
jgi:hypothetical protein